MQFSLMPVCGTTNVIFTLKQLQDKYLAKLKNSHCAFKDSEKACGCLPRDVLCFEESRHKREIGPKSSSIHFNWWLSGPDCIH